MIEKKTEVLQGAKAGFIQMNADQYDCEIVEIGIAGENLARVTVAGTAENLDALFDALNKAFDK